MNNNSLNILATKNGRVIATLDSYGNAGSSNVSLQASGVTHIEAETFPSGNVVTIHPDGNGGQLKLNGGLPPGFFITYRNANQVISNVTLSSNFTFTGDGFLDTLGGSSSPGNIVVSTTAGDVFANVTQLKFDDLNGLDAVQEVPGLVRIEFGPNVYLSNLYANTAYIGDLFANNITANTAYIGDLFANNITANTAYIEDIIANNITANTAYIEDLFANNITANTAYIEDLFANNITANTAYIEDLFANNITANTAYIENVYANNITANTAYIEEIFNNVFTGNNAYIESGFFTNVHTNVLTDNGTSNIEVTTQSVDFIGNEVASLVPPDRIPANYFNAQGLGTKIDISGLGVGQFKPATVSINGILTPQYQPILALNQLITLPPPYGLGPTVYNSPILAEGDGYQDPRPLYPANSVNSVEPTALLNFYGDSGGGYEPSPAPGGYASMRWYTINPRSADKSRLQAQRNLHYSPTYIETSTAKPNAPPDECIPDFPFVSNVLEIRNYSGANVYAESYIGIKKKPSPASDDPDTTRWEWKIHEDYDIDMLPVYYGESGVLTLPPPYPNTANVINEVNKISHEITPGYATRVKLATNFANSAQGSEGNGDVMLEFAPTTSTRGDAMQMPRGQSTYYQEGRQIWQTDADEFNVQLTKDATSTTDAALVTKGGLGVRYQSHFGDRMWLNANADGSFMLFRPFDQGIGSSEIHYDTSNVLSIKSPDLSTVPGTRILRDRIAFSEQKVEVGNDDPALDEVNLSVWQHENALQVDRFTSAVRVNPDRNGTNFIMYSNVFNGSSAILDIRGSYLPPGTNYFTLRHTSNRASGRCLTLEDEITKSRVKFNEGGTIDTWFDFSTTSSNPALRMTPTAFYIGLDANQTNTQFIHYTHNPNQTSHRYFTNVTKEYNINIGRRTRIQETALLNIDQRKIDYFADDGVAQPESMNIMSTSANTVVALSFNADANVYGANNFVHVNPGVTSNVGFKVSTSNVADALIVGSEKALDAAKYGVPFVGVSNTSSNHLAANYATAHGIVYDSKQDRYCYYNSGATDLTCFATTNDLFKTAYEIVVYNSLGELNGNINTSNIGYLAFANIALERTTTTPSNKPDPEPATTSAENSIGPVITFGDGNIRTAIPIERIMARFVFRNSRFSIGTDYGPDNVDTDYPEVGDFNDWMIIQGQNPVLGITPLRRCIFDVKFYFDTAFDETSSMFSDGKEDEIVLGSSCRAFASDDGWITGVEVYTHTPIYIQPGDTTWDGTVNPFKPFIGFYLTSDMSRSRSSLDIQNPNGIIKYLYTYQFTSNASSTTGVYLPNPLQMMLNSEDWVYVEKGDPLPFLGMSVKMGSQNGVFGINSADQDADYACPYMTAVYHWAPKPPKIGSGGLDRRWTLT